MFIFHIRLDLALESLLQRPLLSKKEQADIPPQEVNKELSVRELGKRKTGTTLRKRNPIFPFFLSSFFFFLGPCLQHMEVRELKVELELQPLAYTIATAMPDPSYAAAGSNTRLLTH